MRRRLILFQTVSILALSACQRAAPPAPAEAPAPAALALDINDPASCEPCHAAVVTEWRQSMHSLAHHDKDPIYGGMRALRMEKEGPQIAEQCANCHNPRSPKDTSTLAALAGVSCATCHNVAAIDKSGDKRGAAALSWAPDNLLRGPHDLASGASPVHATGPSPAWMKEDKDALCLSCHGEARNPRGAPTCTTGPERAASAQEGSCASCHMPRVEGPSGAVSQRADHASHAFLGPHRAWLQDDPAFAASGLALRGRLEERLQLTLENRSAHGFPSGYPGRVVALQLKGLDKGGAEIWRAWQRDPMQEAPDLVLNKVYVDEQGEPVMAPFAHALRRDNRLKPDEVRELSLEVPAGVEAVEVAVVMRLVPEKAAKAIGVEGEPEAQPRLLTRLRVERQRGLPTEK